MQAKREFDLKKLSEMRRAGRKRYLATFRRASRENRRWYTDFKEAVAARAGVTIAMVSRVLHEPEYSAPVWTAALEVLKEMRPEVA